jgi:hypothetical protein
MLYPVIGSSIKFNLIIIPKIFISTHPTAVGSVDGERKLPMKGLEPKRWAAVKDAERGPSGAPRSGLDP